MNLLILIFTILVLSAVVLSEIRNEPLNDYDRLEMELPSQKQCCQRSMKCCKTEDEENKSHIELKATMTRCPNEKNEESVLTREMKGSSKNKIIEQFQGFDFDEPLLNNQLRNCHKKTIITLNIKINADDDNFIKKNKFLVVDDVYSDKCGKKVTLLNPYVVKLNFENVKLAYPLIKLHQVNAEATEQVINKKSRSHYRGCNMSPKHSTCDIIKYKGKIVPYSHGFCCSCNETKNEQWQKSTSTSYSNSHPNNGESNLPSVICTDPAFLLDGIECPKNNNNNNNNSKNDNNDDSYFYHSNNTRPTSNLSEMTCKNQAKKNIKSPDINGRWERAVESVNQIRGGQDCTDTRVPWWANKSTYHDSAHCLTFSDLWYNVYQLKQPKIVQNVAVQVYEKYDNSDGKIDWFDLTLGKSIYLNNYENDSSNLYNFRNVVAFDYKVLNLFDKEKLDDSNKLLTSLDPNQAILLVPEGENKKHEEVSNGPGEYLILHPSQLSTTGDRCDVAGVGFEAFFKQHDRCSNRKGTCLRNQPRHLWKHDKEAEKEGKRGCFFLKYYGKLEKNSSPIKTVNGIEYLHFLYPKEISISLNLEIRSDFNSLLSINKSSAIITEVYVENTNSKEILITAKLTNSALISNNFYLEIRDCPLDLEPAFNEMIKTKLITIPPQKQHLFRMTIQYEMQSASSFYCSLEALNSKEELLALRRIRIEKNDRCACVFHCACACFRSLDGLACNSISLEHYHAAGFYGSLPLQNNPIDDDYYDDNKSKTNLFHDLFSFVYYFLAFLILTKLILGVSKATIGILCYPPVGLWGLDVIVDPVTLDKYYEEDLERFQVVFDEKGWPIHPKTGKRVRSFSMKTEFCLNVLFFFTYPTMAALMLLRRIRGNDEEEYQDSASALPRKNTDREIYQAFISHFDSTENYSY